MRPDLIRATTFWGRWPCAGTRWQLSGKRRRVAQLELFHIPKLGGPAGTSLATLPYQIYAMAFDSAGHLWAATGGGPLLELDPNTGAIVNQFGDGITLALAVDPETQQIYVSTAKGVEIFDPTTETFTQFSRDQNLRVSSLAFDS